MVWSPNPSASPARKASPDDEVHSASDALQLRPGRLRLATRGAGVTANQLLTALFNAGIAISVGATVLSLGMTFTVGQLVASLHRVVLVIGLVVLNAGVIPAAAWGIAEVSP